MENEPLFVIRIPSSNLEKSIEYYISNGFKVTSLEEVVRMAWVEKGDLLFCLKESADEHISLILYFADTREFLKKLEGFQIVCDFSADENGNHFEARFTDPAGFEIVVAELLDLPVNCATNKYTELYEISLPAVARLADSVNFWYSLGFIPVVEKARAHPWARLKMAGLTIGLHQSAEWQKPSLFFKGKAPFKCSEEIILKLKSNEKIRVTKTCDHILIYEFMEE